jgi:hypothetical protein
MNTIARALLMTFFFCLYSFLTTTTTAQMTAGPQSGSVFSDDNVIGSYVFGSPPNAAASDNNRSSASAILSVLTGDTHYLKASGFGFSIPSGSIIKGIFVEIEKSASNISILASVEDNSVRLIKGGTIVGTNHKLSGNWPTSESYYGYGSSTDLWGTTWTVADINSSNFGIAFSSSIVGVVGLFPSARVDHMRVTVSYDFIIVPLTIIDFSAIKNTDHSASLKWTTANTDEAALVRVQRSKNGSDWVTLHEQQGEIASTDRTYQYNDAGYRDNTAFYRLQVQHASGSISYSQVVRVNFTALQLSLYPNPSSDYIFLQFKGAIASVRCLTPDGRQKLLNYVQAGNGLYKMNIQQLPPGLYVLQVNESNCLFLKN